MWGRAHECCACRKARGISSLEAELQVVVSQSTDVLGTELLLRTPRTLSSLQADTVLLNFTYLCRLCVCEHPGFTGCVRRSEGNLQQLVPLFFLFPVPGVRWSGLLAGTFLHTEPFGGQRRWLFCSFQVRTRRLFRSMASFQYCADGVRPAQLTCLLGHGFHGGSGCEARLIEPSLPRDSL